MSIADKNHIGRKIEADYFNFTDESCVQENDRYKIIYIKSGSLSLTLNDIKISLAAPCVLLLNEGDKSSDYKPRAMKAEVLSFHASFLNKNITYDMINSGVYERNQELYGFLPLKMFYDRSEGYTGILSLSESVQERVEEFIEDFKQAAVEQDDYRWSCRTRLYLNLLIELFYEVYCDTIQNPIIDMDIRNPEAVVSAVLEQVHTNYRESISLLTLSQKLGINKTTLARIFRKEKGCSITDYIINYRIKCACYALSTTSLKIKEIANECGFKNEAYFIRQFKTKFETTPKQYRIDIVQRRRQALNRKF